jgi:hypothetical protein
LLFSGDGSPPVGDIYIPVGSRFAGGTGGPIVKVGPQDFTLDPGPFHVTGVQFSGTMPGGHGSASFDVPVANAFLAPYHDLYEGAWIVMYDSAHELYEGEILSVKPSVDSSGQHMLSVVCGGLISTAGKRRDLSKTWISRNTSGWQACPLRDYSFTFDGAGQFEFDNELGILVPGNAVARAGWMYAWWNLNGTPTADVISYIDYSANWDVATDADSTWTWDLYVYSVYPLTGQTVVSELVRSESNTTSAGTAGTFTPSLPLANRLLLSLARTGGAGDGPIADKYIRFPTLDIYSEGRTTKPRIDEIMVALATRTGLATSSLSEPIGAVLDDIKIGQGAQRSSAADGMTTAAQLYAQPFEWAFWDDKKFWCQQMPRIPKNDSKVIVVGGGNPGLESWEVAEYDEDVPDYVLVLFGNKDGNSLPEGALRQMYRPIVGWEGPPDNANLKIETLDLSHLILSDAAAAAAGDQVVGIDRMLPSGYTFDVSPATANLGKWPGNNTDPTSLYQDNYSSLIAGTLTDFAYITASGWTGSNSPADPSALVGDGVNDYVTFGDMSAADFGTGAFSVRKWLRLNALPASGTTGVSVSKLDGDRGWYLGITPSGKLRGYVGGSGAVPPVTVTATGTVATTTDGAYTVHKFTGGGTLTVADGYSVAADEVLVVGGGGGGGKSGGGGGAGGYRTGTETLAGTMTVTVGAGGAAGTSDDGGTGGDSIFGTRTAKGGGGGAGGSGPDNDGLPGGSGGGAGYEAGGATGGVATPPGQGNDGGDTTTSGTGGAGGGGAGAAGSNSATNNGGNGGAGLTNDIVQTGVNVDYAGGGGGGGTVGGSATHGGGAGGSNAAGTAGTANTGGGGGGGGWTYNGAAGGSGIVVIRYLTPTATAACRQQTGATTLAVDTWYDCMMTYAGSGGDIKLYINGVAESLTAAGSVGAHDMSTAGSLQLFKGSAAVYLSAYLGRVTIWPRELSATESSTDSSAGQEYYKRSLAKGTVVLKGMVRNRQGTMVPAHHVRAGWWIQNVELGNGDPLYITGHSVDLAGKKNALTIGQDWMEEEIGIKWAEALAIPPTVVPDAVDESYIDPYSPDTSYESDYESDPYVDPGTSPMTPPPFVPEPPVSPYTAHMPPGPWIPLK